MPVKKILQGHLFINTLPSHGYLSPSSTSPLTVRTKQKSGLERLHRDFGEIYEWQSAESF